jgi:hypothetical protein
MDPFDVDDDRAMDADELFLAQVPLQLSQAPPYDVGVTADMEARIVARGLDPIDVGDIHKQQLA